jgi:hypothetical protein
MRVHSLTDSELSADVVLPDDAFRFEVFANPVDIPFAELQLALSYQLGDKTVDRVLLLPVGPLSFCRFFTAAEAERDEHVYQTGAEKSFVAENPLFQGRGEAAVRALFPYSYANVNNDLCGVFAFCTNDILVRYEATTQAGNIKLRLYALSLSGHNGVAVLNSAILLLLQNVQFLLK